jgi:hypothetical protein
VFALLCIGFAINGFSQIDAMADEAARSDARGFAYFFLFLGAVAVASAIVSWRIIRRETENPSD